MRNVTLGIGSLFAGLVVLVGTSIGCGNAPFAPPTECPSGQALCGTNILCVALDFDPKNCGGCGVKCADGEVCSGGSCGLTCGGGTTRCGDDCIDTQFNPANCGACETSCFSSEVCSQGTCSYSCGGGTTECSGLCVDTQVDPANCGACAMKCENGEVCSAGSCGLLCAGGTTKCGDLCVDTQVDPANCNACDAQCASGEVCAQGSCVLICPAGLVNCGGACVDPNYNPAYCGASGDCLGANQGTVCATGVSCDNGVCGQNCVTNANCVGATPLCSSNVCTVAQDCDDLIGGPSGVYVIDPDLGGANAPFAVYCDLTTGTAGWTLLLSANATSTYFGNNSPDWLTTATTGAVPFTLSISTADFKSTAYSELSTNELRLCYQDVTRCHVFTHALNLPLRSFFADKVSFTEYAFDVVGYADAGTAANRAAYLADLGFTPAVGASACFWLGINHKDTPDDFSAFGLLGDNSNGCASQNGSTWTDDMAIGLGLQSCNDANSCGPGGTGHTAGRNRFFNGIDDSGDVGPWFVFGR